MLIEIPTAATLLAGFVLAHAVWSVSDTSPSELLAPLAIVERGGQRTLQRFEAATQLEAIENGKRAMTEATRTADAWAFAREGSQRIPRDNPKAEDVIVVDFWSKGKAKPATAIQRFDRATKDREFRVVGEPMISVDGKVVDDATAKSVVEALLRGVATHSEVAPLWPKWRGNTKRGGV